MRLGGEDKEIQKPKEKKTMSGKGLMRMLTGRKRERIDSPEMKPVIPQTIRLNFLFVGASCSGQTSLL